MTIWFSLGSSCASASANRRRSYRATSAPRFAAMEMFFNLNGHEIVAGAHGQIAGMVVQSAHPDRQLRLLEADFADQLDPYVHEIGVNPLQGGILAAGTLDYIHMSISKAGTIVMPGTVSFNDLTAGVEIYTVVKLPLDPEA